MSNSKRWASQAHHQPT